jgi:hypothetical protein
LGFETRAYRLKTIDDLEGAIAAAVHDGIDGIYLSEPFRKELESRESLVIPWTAPDSEVPHLEAGTSSDRRPARLALRE